VADGVLVGIQGVLPGADVQFNFFPATDPTEYVDGLIGEILRAKETAGIVVTKVPFVVQRAIKDSGLPAVVHGSLYPSINGWPGSSRTTWASPADRGLRGRAPLHPRLRAHPRGDVSR
jgi:hypothetical protein